MSKLKLKSLSHLYSLLMDHVFSVDGNTALYEIEEGDGLLTIRSEEGSLLYFSEKSIDGAVIDSNGYITIKDCDEKEDYEIVLYKPMSIPELKTALED